jgi:hypothetical protein
MFAHRRSGLLIGWPLLVLSSGLTSGGAASSNAINQWIAIEEDGQVRPGPSTRLRSRASVRARSA